MGISESVIASLFIDGTVIYVFSSCRLVFDIGSGCQHSAVRCGSRDGSGVHERHCGDLTLARLGSFPVCEVSGRVAHGETVVCRRVPRPEAGAAEARLQDGAALEQFRRYASLNESQIYRRRRGIYRQIEEPVSYVLPSEDVFRFGNIVEHSSGAAADHSLVDMYLSVFSYRPEQIHLHSAFQRPVALLLDRGEYSRRVFLKFVDRIGFGRVERERNH